MQEMAVLLGDVSLPGSPRLPNAGYRGVATSHKHEATEGMERLLSQPS
ncbi:MAG TPA: hypothetical protein VNH20_05100 [Candidatus Dormibacteraeota bacterium]|nr:hypothetical protein [Candidatus Dormibacteraeota bacterium]